MTKSVINEWVELICALGTPLSWVETGGSVAKGYGNSLHDARATAVEDPTWEVRGPDGFLVVPQSAKVAWEHSRPLDEVAMKITRKILADAIDYRGQRAPSKVRAELRADDFLLPNSGLERSISKESWTEWLGILRPAFRQAAGAAVRPGMTWGDAHEQIHRLIGE